MSLGGTKFVLPPISSNMRTETATAVSFVEDLPKKLTHHFTPPSALSQLLDSGIQHKLIWMSSGKQLPPTLNYFYM